MRVGGPQAGPSSVPHWAVPRSPRYHRPPSVCALILVTVCCAAVHPAHASAPWTITLVDTAGSVGLHASHAVDASGAPHAAYYDATKGDLKYATRAGGIWTIERVDSIGDVGRYASLALDSSGQPHIAYYDATQGRLKYASRLGGAWFLEVVDGVAGQVRGKYASLAIDKFDIPHIAYLNGTTFDARYATRPGTVWLRELVDPAGDAGTYASIAVDVLGQPQISYRDETTGHLRWARKVAGIWTPETVDGAFGTGYFSSLALDPAGDTHIAYFDSTNGDLRYARRSAGIWTLSLVDPTDVAGQFCSLALDSAAAPCIIYRHVASGNSDLRYASFGTGFWTITRVDSTGDTGLYNSLAFGPDWRPTIACFDDSTDDFKYGDPPPTHPIECAPTFEWRRADAIQFFGAGVTYWPNGPLLYSMRPGDAIAISATATDTDVLVETCRDCYDRTRTMPWGPYQDRLTYEWKPVRRGRLIVPDVSEPNTVIYQMPICGWEDINTKEYVTQKDTVELEIWNHPADGKAEDPALTGTKIIFTMTPCAGGLTLYAIRVSIQVILGTAPPGEIVTPTGEGTCDPIEPFWEAGTPISTSDIQVTDVPELCPDYVTLLSVDPSDVDPFNLWCNSRDPDCPETYVRSESPHQFGYLWSVVSGRGRFVLGDGPVVAFQRAHGDSAVVKCRIWNVGGQAVDPAVEIVKKVAGSKRAKALVAVGDDEYRAGISGISYGGHMADLARAADVATQRYLDAGYQVFGVRTATQADVLNAFRSSCFQAIWLTGHGALGYIFMNPPPRTPSISPGDLSDAARHTWGCGYNEAHPFIRELVLLGCETYQYDWNKMLICGDDHSFDFKFWPVPGASLVGRDPLDWENQNHHPLPPHDLSLP